MSKARLIITVVVEGRTKSEVARDYEVSRYWVQTLVKRFMAEGEAAYEPRSRRPHTSPHAVSAAMEDRILRLRKELTKQGLDAGADTIRTHLARRTPRSTTSTSPSRVPAVSTIWRVLTRRGFVTPQPQKRPRSSWRRYTAEQPNERWQADTTHWQLADGTGVEILNLLDDHSRVALASIARRSITGPDVLHTFQEAFRQWGIPASVLTDNGGGLHRHTPPRRQGLPRGRTRPPRRPVPPLPALPPPDLREGRTLPADREEVARRATTGQDDRRAAAPAHPVPALLQRHPPPPPAPERQHHLS